MRYRAHRRDENEDLNIWPAFTDLMSNAFMIMILFLLLAIVKSVFLQRSLGETETPPIIVIEDEAAYRFASGSAAIPPPMDAYIRNKIVPAIEQYTARYQINVIELIGHTDGQPNGGITSNLDRNIEKVAGAELPVSNLKSGSNADLGLMRSLAVVKVLRDIQTK